MTRSKERKILNQCIKKNRCDKLVAAYWRLVCATVRRTFGLKGAPIVQDQVEEVCQDVFLQLLDDDRRRLRLYREGEGHSLARWIVVIATHTTLNFLRKRGFDSFLGQAGRMDLNEFQEDPADLESEVLGKVALNTALQVVSQTDRIILRLHRFGMPAKDIAVVVDSTEAAIHNRISRIKKTLSEFVDDR
jgi:RNA polymerase sigma factor (sigma-70 family)